MQRARSQRGRLALGAMVTILAMTVGCSDDDGQDNNNVDGGQSTHRCGDGVPNGAEECDDGPANSDSQPDACRTNCTRAHCGDGVVDALETCDDGPANSDQVPDVCRADCTPARCGDGVVDIGRQESCDDENQTEGDGCSPTCQVEFCGNGHVDPDEQCDDGNNAPGDDCGPTCLREECGNGHVDPGETCDDGNTDADDGCGPACLTEVCGNRYLDPDEVCDDGNIEAGDGCGALCLSDETCGNTRLDAVVGEQCDDGNALSADGCSSACRAETPTWRRVSRVTFEQTGFAVAYHPLLQATVLLGVSTDDPTRLATWLYRDEQWSRMHTATRVPERRMHQLVWDAERRQLVLFGGEVPVTGPLNDTWVFDGFDWTAQTPNHAPTPRANHAMAYDAARGLTVLYGGRTSAGPVAETWIFDGDDWTLLAPVDSPPPLTGARMVYDADRDRVVLFGGQDDTGTVLNQTWEWDGSTWDAPTLAVSPLRRTEHAMLYDGHRRRVVLAGGQVDGTFYLPWGEFWIYRDSSWEQLPNPGWALDRLGYGLAYDPVTHSYVLPGGDAPYVVGWQNESQPYDLVETYEYYYRYGASVWGGSYLANWEPNGCHALGWHRIRDQLLCFGWGNTSQFDGVSWRVVWPTEEGQVPPVDYRGWSARYYDPHRDRFVSFGGRTGGAWGIPLAYHQDTWEFDGAQWYDRTGSSPPAARYQAAIAYDASRMRGVLFGGWDDTTIFDDTWLYTASGWAPQPTPAKPPARYDASLAYDVGRDRLVLFGGHDGLSPLADTWEFDGTNWVEVTPAASPPGRHGATLSYHPARRRVVLTMGTDDTRDLADTWEFDGTSWVETTPAEVPTGTRMPAIYDPVQRRLVASTGDGLFAYQYESPLPPEVCDDHADNDGDGLTDCDDPDCAGLACSAFGARCGATGCDCPGGTTEAACDDGMDNDCDGRVDCEDQADCGSASHCAASESACDDGVDNDGDRLVDCQDWQDCGGDPSCEALEVTCDDDVDNDGDGLTDADDPDCVGDPVESACGDGVDNDGDLLVDCADPDCVGDAGCTAGGLCAAAVPISCDQSVSGDTATGVNTLDQPCSYWAGYDGPELVYAITPTTERWAEITFTSHWYYSYLDVFVVGAAPSGGCDPAERCHYAKRWSSGQSASGASLLLEAGQTYFIIVDGQDGSSGAFDLALHCTPP